MTSLRMIESLYWEKSITFPAFARTDRQQSGYCRGGVGLPGDACLDTWGLCDPADMPAACVGYRAPRTRLQTKHSQCWNCFAVDLPRSCEVWSEVEEEPRNQGTRRLPDHQAQALATRN
ncbi:hypothetical protein M422DRAFT_255931 [Sphaerobolus stellatus SS14]|uniref:Uncharacterized protein n=1 Tax=Sphaerobolus stellatus (strain SS14) TaxID=990650 RepID=A0A0C9V239_SPHS4|nr:hypothetical protein M422DRAFT_255931 [Sphaerobolus stellatus SS14]